MLVGGLFNARTEWHMYWQELTKVQIHIRGPLHRTRDRWPTIDRSKVGPISQSSLKSNEKVVAVWDPCVLIDLSAISPSGWANLAFFERSLRDHWEIDERSMRLLNAPWPLLDHFLSIRWSFIERVIERSLPLAIVEILFWSESKLWGDCVNHGDHWTISERSFRDLGDRWAIAGHSLTDCWEIWPFVITQRSLNDRHLWVKGGFSYIKNYISVACQISSDISCLFCH